MLLTIKQVHQTNLMSEITTSAVLDEAFSYIYQSRKKDNANSDIWDLSLRWLQIKKDMREKLLSGVYQLSPVVLYHSKNNGFLTRWSAEDAVVLKALSLILTDHVISPPDKRCMHLKSNGGLKGAVNSLANGIKNYRFVIKSDVASFYDSMTHSLVMHHCKEIIKDKRVLSIIYQYLNRVEISDAEHNLIYHGIAKGCPLSPLMGAIILKSLDKMLPTNCFYVRYMDDWAILIKARHLCRRLVKKMHLVMHRLKFKLAIDKTFIGRINKGFEFLGYCFNHQGLIGLAKKTIQNFIEHVRMLYEQDTSDRRVAQYVRRWIGWCGAGLRVN